MVSVAYYLSKRSYTEIICSIFVNPKNNMIQTCLFDFNNQLLQLCMVRTVFSILRVTVRLYTVMAEVCRWLTNEKHRKTDRRVTDQ